MGEREQRFRTVTEFRDADNPNQVQISHTSETGEEPVYVSQETFLGEDKIEAGKVDYQRERHKLEELTRDFLMFSLAPVYLVCLWDWGRNQIKFDLIYRFIQDMRLSKGPRVIHYQSEYPILRWSGEIWDHLLQGLPRGDNMEFLFPKWVEQLVLVNREVTPMEYWRVNARTVRVSASSIVAMPVDITVFVPTGVDKQLDLRVRPDGSYEFIQLPPEEWVVEEAMRYFGGVEA